MRRCTLMAVICNHAGLQKHLPQALLPRDRAKKEPAAKMKRLYSSMGAPSEAWHGTGGHTDTHTHDEAVVETCCTSCEAALGDMPIILAMDTHPVHIGEPILRCTTSLGLHVVVVPARRTWFLQPLDAKVFRQTHWDSNVINVYANYEGLFFVLCP